jgi:hypothetical protein
MIVLKDADEEIVGEALTLAWQRISAAAAPKKRAASKTARKRASH